MTLIRLALYSTLGMLASGIGVYSLTPPGLPRAPADFTGSNEDGQVPRAPEPPTVAMPTIAPDAPPEPLGVAETASLEASALPVDSSLLPPTRPQTHASPQRAVTAQTASVASYEAHPELFPSCRPALTEHQWRVLTAGAPLLLQLPPEKQMLIRVGSPQCACGPDASGQKQCHDWCVSKGGRTGVCLGMCQCSL